MSDLDPHELVKKALALSVPQREAFLRQFPREHRDLVEALIGTSARAEGKEMAPAPIEPTGQIGPFELLEVLGQGGEGTVRRARHVETGQEVALKTVRAPRSYLLGGIRREIEALAGICHPGIVRIVKHGVEAGLPWYAMELLSGRSLRREIRLRGSDTPTVANLDGETVPVHNEMDVPPLDGSYRGPGIVAPPVVAESDLPRILSLVRRLCAPLAYLHGRGIVHRDLKPDNVVVLPDGRPVIVDFGLMARFAGETGRDSLEVTGGVSGTAAYMAPEQGAGELVDARADLYALGCILYELIAGRPPFTGASPLQIVVQHQLQPTPDLPTIVPWLPFGVHTIVSRLLEKDPRRRFGYAVDVAAALEAQGAETGEAGPPPEPYLYRPRLAGREVAQGRLQAALEDLHAGRGGLILVRGPSGSGKTRLALELSAAALQSGVRVLAGRCQPSGGPLHPLRDPLQSTMDHFRDHPPKGLPLESLRVLAEHHPDLTTLPGVAALPPPPPLPEEAARDRLYQALRVTLLASAHRGVLILDDLQWVDELTRGWLVRLGRLEPSEHQLLVVGTRRSDLPLRTELAAASSTTLDLPRLDDEAVGLVVADMLAMDPPPESLSLIVAERSEGNPYFVSEYLRVMVRERILCRDASGRWTIADQESLRIDDVPVPYGVRDLLAYRLNALDEPLRDELLRASVLGREWDAEVLEKMSRSPQANPSLLQLVHDGFVVEVAPGRFRFENDHLREVAYETLEPERRRRAHEAAAEILDRGPDCWPQHGAEIGSHRENAGQIDRALECYLAAARKAEAGYALEESARLYQRYVSLASDDAPHLALALARWGGRVLIMAGRHQEAQPILRRGVTIAKERNDHESVRFCLVGLARISWTAGRLDDAECFYEEAIASAREEPSERARGAVLGNMGGVLQQTGRYPEARRAFEEALDIARSHGDRQSEGAQLGNLACVASQSGDFDTAESLFEEAISLQSALDDRLNLARNLNNLGGIYSHEGRTADARAMFERAIKMQTEMGNRQDAAVSTGSLAHWFSREGDDETAVQLYERALTIHQDMGNLLMEGIIVGNLAQIKGRRGQDVEAEQDLKTALKLVRAARGEQFEAGRWVELGAFFLSRGRYDEARAHYLHGLEIYRKVGHARFSLGVLHEISVIERRVGNLDASEQRLEEANELDGTTVEVARRVRHCIEWGRLALARGEDPGGWLARAEDHLQLENGAPLVTDQLENFRRTVVAFRSGDTLAYGEVPDDPPPDPVPLDPA